MRIRLQLTREEVQKIISDHIGHEASKHGHPSNVDRIIRIRHGNDDFLPLESLDVTCIADIETK